MFQRAIFNQLAISQVIDERQFKGRSRCLTSHWIDNIYSFLVKYSKIIFKFHIIMKSFRTEILMRKAGLNTNLLCSLYIYLFKNKNRNIRKRYKTCSKLTIKTLERRHWRRPGVFSVSFGYISQLSLLSLMLALNTYIIAEKVSEK